MCILCSDYVYLLKCILGFCNMDFNFVSRFCIDGICVVALAPATSTTYVSGACPVWNLIRHFFVYP